MTKARDVADLDAEPGRHLAELVDRALFGRHQEVGRRTAAVGPTEKYRFGILYQINIKSFVEILAKKSIRVVAVGIAYSNGYGNQRESIGKLWHQRIITHLTNCS